MRQSQKKRDRHRYRQTESEKHTRDKEDIETGQSKIDKTRTDRNRRVDIGTDRHGQIYSDIHMKIDRHTKRYRKRHRDRQARKRQTDPD